MVLTNLLWTINWPEANKRSLAGEKGRTRGFKGWVYREPEEVVESIPFKGEGSTPLGATYVEVVGPD
jgi:hypothetical protein